MKQRLTAHIVRARMWRIGVDAFLVALAWIAAYWLRFLLNDAMGLGINPFHSYVAALPLIVLTWLLSSWFFGLYHRTRTKTTVERIQDLLKSVLLGVLLICSIGFIFKEWMLGRTVVLLSSVLNLFFLSGSWWFFRRLEKKRLQAGNDAEVRSLIIGANDVGIRLLQRIEDHPEVGYKIIGFLEASEAEEATLERHGGCPVLGTLSSLPNCLEAHQIDEVFVACPDVDSTKIFGLISACDGLGVDFWMVTDAFEVLSRGHGPMNTIGDLPLIQLNGTQPSFFYEIAKRVFDVVVAVVALIASAPMWLYWIYRIKRDSPGPALFTQLRCGHRGETFTIYKFRTMRQEAEQYAEAPKAEGDDRITPYGAWLRRTSIDEVPQLINVIKGDMSLVGPRPEMPFIVDTYTDWQRSRLSVKPGLTGLWQILGRKDLPMHENLQYDFYYIHNRSLLLDVSILIRTVFVVLWRKGAY